MCGWVGKSVCVGVCVCVCVAKYLTGRLNL